MANGWTKEKQRGGAEDTANERPQRRMMDRGAKWRKDNSAVLEAPHWCIYQQLR